MVVPTHWFGGNSSGGMAMEEWLADYCDGCRFSSRKIRRNEGMGGFGCDLPTNAYLDPYKDIPEWSPDAGDDPDELTCMKRERRPESPLKGIHRGPRQLVGQESLL